MATIGLLHLTDLHRGMKDQDDLLPGVRESFFDDLARLHERCGPWDAVLFTGDLVQRGKKEELKQLDVFLDSLWDHLSCLQSERPALLAVPGNHDLVRPEDNAELLGLIDLATSPHATRIWDKLFTRGSDYRKVVDGAFRAYSSWWAAAQKRWPGKISSFQKGALPGEYSAVLEKDGARIGFVGLNSALLHLADGDFDGRLALHVRQLQKACGGDEAVWFKDGLDAAILMTHHPPSWLYPNNEQQVFNASINPPGRFAAHFCGHLHEAETESYALGWGPDRKLIRGGSLFGIEPDEDNKVQRIHAYSVSQIRIEEGRLQMRLWPRLAQSKSGGAWKFEVNTKFDLDKEGLATDWKDCTPLRRAPSRPQVAVPKPDAKPDPKPDATPASRPDVGPAPVLDPDALFHQRFIGRDTELGDYQAALDGLMARSQRTRANARTSQVQLIWLHGFGGMGKSWFLRRAGVDAQSESPAPKVALVDWYLPDWCKPAKTPPTDAREMFQAIAYRIAQLYGAEHLDPYWETRQRVDMVWGNVASLYGRLEEILDHIQTNGPAWSNSAGAPGEQGLLSGAGRIPKSEMSFVERLLREHRFWSDDPAKLSDRIALLRRAIPRYDLPDPGGGSGLFNAWLDHVAGKHGDLITRPCGLLADALQGCLRRVCAEAPLVLILDTCEMLSPVLDGWLRRLLAGLIDGVTPLLVLVSSRHPPDHYVPEGERIGWRNEIPPGHFRGIPFDQGSRFSLTQISQALEAAGLDLSQEPELPGLVHRVTLGVPMAVGELLDLHAKKDPVLRELSSLDEGAAEDLDLTRAMETVIRKVAGRFLLHLENKPEAEDDLRDVTALALLRHASTEVLRSFWRTLDPRPRLRDLSLRYSLLADGDLHETVREYLRRRWRSETSLAVVDVATALSEALQQTRPDEPPGSLGRVEWELERLNLMSWSQGVDAYPEFARMLAVFLAYDSGVSELLSLAHDIEPRSPQHEKTRKMWDPWIWWTRSPETLRAMEWLQKQVNASWDAHDRACLALYWGLCLEWNQRSAEAVQHFEAAFQSFGREVPRPDDVGKVYFRAVQALGQSASTAATRAVDFARQLGLADEGEWNVDYYWVLHNSQQYDHAESYCRRCMEAEPENMLPRTFLGHVVSVHQKRPMEAERLLREGLVIDEDDANIHFFLAQTLENQLGRSDEAEAEFHLALAQVSLAIDRARVLEHLGELLWTRPGRRPEAIKLLREALQLSQEKRPDLCNSVAWALYFAGTDLIEAEELARAGLARKPESLPILQTLAAILVRQGKWSDARSQLKTWAGAAEVSDLRNYWHEIILMFRDALTLGRGADMTSIVDGRTDPLEWKALGAALRAAASGSQDFSHLPEPLRGPAETLRQQLLSETTDAVFPDLPESISP